MPQPSLTLSQEQRLQMVLAPQLRQSLQMLQLPLMELRSMLQQELEQNPTLEDLPVETPTLDSPEESTEPEPDKELEFKDDFEVLAALDDEWREYFFQEHVRQPFSADDAKRRQFFLDSLPQQQSLQEHLMTQLDLAGLSADDHQIGELIVGSIDDDGYLITDLREMADTAALDHEHVEDVLAVVQDFNPVGVGARDLRECLTLQLDRLGNKDETVREIVASHLKKLGARKIQDIARSMKITPEEVQAAADFIARLDPRPGRAYTTEAPSYVLPEITVQKIEGEYVVILNDDQLPRLRISNHYRTLMRSDSTSRNVKEYITEKIRSGVFLMKSIQQRQQTLFKIASEIVKVQTEFLDSGVKHLKPLTMSQVADVVGVHETTVSRAVAGKYMKTPGGVFEMKYFFTPGLKTASGTNVSNKTVQDKISSLVAAEDPSKPLSDQEIVGLLKEAGIKVARRTVAKYRLILRIPPSHMRKSY